MKRTGALPLAELAEQLRAAEREVSSGTLSNTLQTMKKRGRSRRQMDAAEDTREESQGLTVLPHDYGILIR